MLQICIGSTPVERTQNLQQIKDAMTVALIGRIENDSAGNDDQPCNVFICIYFEAANCLQNELKKETPE